MVIRRIDPGDKFSSWTVVKPSAPIHGHESWVCECRCGQTGVVQRGDLLRGSSTRCRECAGKARQGANNGRHLHGSCDTRLYKIWSNIKSRCLNPKNVDYKYYGGRGIGICDEWKHSFSSLKKAVEALGEWPGKGYSLDRTENNKGYEPGNLRWATRSQQVLNSRRWEKKRF